MAAPPAPAQPTVAAIVQWYERRGAAERARSYLGCSELGHECERFLWLSFRGAKRRQFPGTMLRLFESGHREEARAIENMRAVGIKVWDRDERGGQWAVQALGGHVRGHLDAVVLGLLEAPAVPHVWDNKTAKAEKWRAVVKHGIRKTYPQYYAQGQMYMGLMDLGHAAFLFVNKDTDELHLERFEFDQAEFDRLMARAERIVFGTTPPPKAGEKADDLACRWCDFQSVCWGTDVPPAGCRTCAHATPEREGGWTCERDGAPIDEGKQARGCGRHRVIPILLSTFADAIDTDGDAVTYRHRESGRQFVNGPRPGYSSAEIAACADKTMLADAGVDQLREMFDGAIVG